MSRILGRLGSLGRGAALGLLLLGAPAADGAAQSPEIVNFDSAVVPHSRFKKRKAEEKGIELAPLPQALALSGELRRPAGAGPFHALVLMHGCTGIGAHERAWAEELTARGFVTLLLDSFGPRGIDRACTGGTTNPAADRVLDAYGALAYLQNRPEVRGRKVGLFGWSHGADAVLYSVARTGIGATQGRGFSAAVAYHPGCTVIADFYLSPLIFIGELDQPAIRTCARMKGTRPAGVKPMRIRVFPEAYHNFDMLEPDADPDLWMGGRRYWVRHDEEASAGARRLVETYLAEIFK